MQAGKGGRWVALIVSLLAITWMAGGGWAASEPLESAVAVVASGASRDDESRPRLVVNVGHTTAVTSIAFSPDGRTLASGSWDHTIKLWEVATGREIKTLSGHTNWVCSVAFSPDGRTLASGSWDRTIKLWEVATGREIATLGGDGDFVLSVAFSPDGRTLASGGWYHTIKLWEVATGTRIRPPLTGHTSWVTSIAFSPDGRTLATGSGDKTIKLWEVASGKEIRTLPGHTDTVNSIAFSPDGRTLASGSDDHTIRLWEVATGREIDPPLTGHTDWVNSVAFSPDGRTLASGSWDHTIRLWRVATGRETKTLSRHTDGVLSVAFSPDGRTLASGSGDHTIKLWEVATGAEIRTMSGRASGVRSVAFSLDGQVLASGSGDHTIKLWEMATGAEIETLSGHGGSVYSVAFSPDGRTLASGSEDDTIKLWEVATGREIRSLGGHAGSVYSVGFSPDGKTLASGNSDGTVRLWEVATGRETKTLGGHTDLVLSVAFSHDGRTLASGSSDRTIKLWEVATGRELRTLSGHTGDVWSVCFSPEDRTLASGSWDHTIRLWEVATGREINPPLTGHAGWVNSVAFSLDGRTLASGSGDDTIKLWEVATGREINPPLTGHTDWVNSVAFSPDRRTLASGSNDGSVRFWDVSSGREEVALYSLGASGWAVLDPEGRYDASNGGKVEGLHWVVGNELIELQQLKSRYYAPRLLAKHLGLNKEPLTPVGAFRDVKLFPEVAYKPPTPGNSTLTITLRNRGGGIGPVQVLVNDNEVVADARGPHFDPSAPEATLTVDLSTATFLRGQENSIRVVAWNAEGYLSSRGFELAYAPPGQADTTPPELYAIVGGISDYSSPSLHLHFAAKDAEDFATALSLGAKRLFGTEKVHLALLSTSGNPQSVSPTKEHFRQAFEEACRAKPTDILVVYLAGHGLSLARDRDLYCYLTQEAQATEAAAFSDPAVLAQSAVTSEELAAWVHKINARKKVLVLDTCAAGAAAARLMETRDIPANQVLAIEGLKDRTGFHVLMGCTADAVSYEASQYGQGLLTYALLQGIKGAALRDDEFVDVSTLFQHAERQVPQLARGLGGIQRPQIAARAGTSFDIGELTSEDKAAVPLAAVKPVILRPIFMNRETDEDDLNLTVSVRKTLKEESFVAVRGGEQARYVYVDADEMPEAIRASGSYLIEGDAVKVTLTLRREETVKKIEIQGSKGDVGALVQKVATAIAVTAGSLKAYVDQRVSEPTGQYLKPAQEPTTRLSETAEARKLRFVYDYKSGPFVRRLSGTVADSQGLWNELAPLQPPPGASGAYGLIGDDYLLGKEPGFGLRQLGRVARKYLTFDTFHFEQPTDWEEIGIQSGISTKADELNNASLGWAFFDVRGKFEVDLKQLLGLAP